jgi:phage gp29-like protein
MAKKKPNKSKSESKPESGGLFLHEAELALINYLTKMPDGDEVLRKAGITRHRLKVMMYDDEIYQCVEKRQDKLESAPWRLEPADTTAAQILNDHLREWWSDIVLGAQNARWYGYSVLEAVYNENALHVNGDTITPFIGLEWIGEKPMQWYEPKNDGRLILLQNFSKSRLDEECNQHFKHFLTRCKPTYENPYGEALLSRLYWVWFFKNNGFKMWAKFVEQFGMPMLVGKSSIGKNDDMRDALLRAHASRVLAVSASDTIEVTASGVNSGNASGTYDTFDKNLERRIQKVVLGQTLTSGTDGSGSRALGDVHMEVQNSKYKADIRMILPTIQAILNALCDLNRWERHRIIIGEEKSLEGPKADRDVKLKNAGANFTSQYFQREYGLEEGDIADIADPAQIPLKQFSALPHQAFSFKASVQKHSPEQQEVDELTDAQDDLELLNQDQIKQLVADSSDPQDLASNLMQLIPMASKAQFKANLDQALYAGDVLGYVTANNGK